MNYLQHGQARPASQGYTTPDGLCESRKWFETCGNSRPSCQSDGCMHPATISIDTQARASISLFCLHMHAYIGYYSL